MVSSRGYDPLTRSLVHSTRARPFLFSVPLVRLRTVFLRAAVLPPFPRLLCLCAALASVALSFRPLFLEIIMIDFWVK